ncbi:MAG: glycine betaine ABC transporter substrate-binding protein [Eubacteriales bacterium]|nr:glycine betaine ABC transporter substrate-binding protein [Eubacteriales bacterium]
MSNFNLIYDHLIIVSIATAFSIVIGILLGVIAYWVKHLDSAILWFSDTIQTIPSLALLSLLMIGFGLGNKTLIIGLVLYSLLPIVRNTYTGIMGIPTHVKEAARGMGMSKLQRLFKVELPLAFPLIFSGIKLAIVTSLGTAVMGVLIGAGGLGYPIYRGIQTRNMQLILSGAIPVVLLALIFDYVMSKIECMLTKRATNKKSKGEVKMLKKLIGFVSLALIGGALLSGCSGSTDKVVVGSKDFSENIIIGEMFAQLIEEHTDLKVERKLNMGGTFVCFEAIKKGDISIYPEYTGTGLTAQLKMDVMSDPDETYKVVKEEFDKQFGIKWLKPFGFNNTYAIAVSNKVAEENDLETCSDLARVADKLIFGAEHEFFNRQDGYDGFIDLYGVNFKDVAKMNVSLKYQAIGEGQMDVTDTFATDGQIKQYNLKILEDDKGFFPPYYAAPIIKKDVLEKHPEIENVLNKLSGQISDADMTELNFQVDVEQKDVAVVAKEFLVVRNLIK